MKFKDYYAVLGVERTATAAEIKKAYRKLAHRYHPDVSKLAGAEEKFKEVGEAYETLKDPEKRAAYDELGRHPAGQDFQPPPDWGEQFGAGGFENFDLGDILAGLNRGQGRARRAPAARPGADYETKTEISLLDAFQGNEIDLDLVMPEDDYQSMTQRVSRRFRIRVPKGAVDGQRLRLAGKGAPGQHGGRAGDLYVNLVLKPHPLFRVSGKDLYLDLPLTPSEAVLGADVEVPTLSGSVELKVRAGTRAGQSLRLTGKGMPHAGGAGNLFAVVQIVVPQAPSEAERDLYRQLQALSDFKPRAHFP